MFLLGPQRVSLQRDPEQNSRCGKLEAPLGACCQLRADNGLTGSYSRLARLLLDHASRPPASRSVRRRKAALSKTPPGWRRYKMAPRRCSTRGYAYSAGMNLRLAKRRRSQPNAAPRFQTPKAWAARANRWATPATGAKSRRIGSWFTGQSIANPRGIPLGPMVTSGLPTIRELMAARAFLIPSPIPYYAGAYNSLRVPVAEIDCRPRRDFLS
jgi:hypothetical protein